ncbi:MAG: TetR family transcriptional regulator [Eggerthellaceae bacterium]|nr:TetR family transcriptional regulator [Eggerthellaceae bacterium]
MAEREESRRVLMTKRLLKEALLELLDEKPLEEISVAELCRRADVQRATFYNHYAIVEDLYNDIKREWPGEPYSSILGGTFERLVESYSQHVPRRYIYTAIKNQLPDFTDDLEVYVTANRDALREARPDIPDELAEYLGLFLTRGCQAMTSKWLDSDRDITVEQISHLVEVCATHLPLIADELEQYF